MPLRAVSYRANTSTTMDVYSNMFKEVKTRSCEAITAVLDFWNKGEDKKV